MENAIVRGVAENPIVKCRGEYCRIRSGCARYLKEKDKLYQPYFFEEPIDPDGINCKFYLPSGVTYVSTKPRHF